MLRNKKQTLRSALKGAVAVAVSLAMISCCCVTSFASELSEARRKLAAAKKQEATAQTQLDAQYEVYYAICDEVDAAKGKVDAVQSRIDKLNKNIRKIQSDINKVNEEIAAKQREIDAQQKLMDQKYEEFKNRLKALYISGNTSTVEALLTCDDFSTYLTRLEMIKKVADRDSEKIEELKKLVEELKKMQEKLDADKKTLADKKAQVEDKKKDLVADKKDLQAEYNKLNSKKSEANTELQKCQSLIASIKAKQKSYQSEINKLMAQANNAGSAVVGSGRFCYPVPSCTTVSCGYYGYANHNGVDFSNGGIYGATVVAADSGTVVIVRHQNYSYGNHIYINHGNGLVTLYAHLSATYVSPGQTVSRGQAIGAVGSTGNSTGPHLHFGVTSGGGWVNPFNYL